MSSRPGSPVSPAARFSTEVAALEDEQFLLEKQDTTDYTGIRPQKSLRYTIILLVQLTLLVAYATVTYVYVRARGNRPPTFEAIDGLSIQYNPQPTNFVNTTAFFGPPGDETDGVWEELMENKYIRVSKTELDRNHRSSLQLDDETYLVWLGVYHELHCLNLIRKWNDKHHYFSSVSAEKEQKLRSHVDHCLDRIREYLMCHADFSSLMTMDWDPNLSRPLVNGTKTLHSCVDWDVLVASTKQRTIREEQIKLLKAPSSTSMMIDSA